MKKTKIFVVLIIIAAVSFISYIYIFGLSFEGKESDFYVPVVTGDNISTYKNSCIELNLSQVSKDPYSLIGKRVYVTGQIAKKEEFVQFNKIRTGIVLKVPELSPIPYILVSYSSTILFKQDDMITVYGEYNYPSQYYYHPAQDKIIPEIADKFLPVIRTAYIEKI